VKEHSFFASLDFEQLLRKEVKPPYIPSIAPSDSLFHFDKTFMDKVAADSPGVPASANAHELFRGFSFVAPLLLDEVEPVEDMIPVSNNSDKSSSVISRLKSADILSKCKARSLNEYEFHQEIGQGSYSICKRCVHKETNQQYAVKIINKGKRDCSEEVEIMLRFSQHPNIVTLHDVYEDTQHVYLFMDLLEGGELLDRILSQKYFSEREASVALEIVTKTVKYLHENGVVHRDLKPSNILYADSSGDPSSIRICDFGFAKQVRAGNGLLMTPCYTANFVAPEVLKKQGYDQACDIWSLGVLLYTMLAGHTPFANGPDDTPNTILAKVGEGCFDLSSGNWPNISQTAKHLVQKMLHLDPKQRYRAVDVLKHAFITNPESLPTRSLPHQEASLVKANVGRVFNAINTPSPINLDPVTVSGLAKRRANRRSNASTEI
jgi:p90 ribosomal S6 kinase